jgi:hypothetical protein
VFKRGQHLIVKFYCIVWAVSIELLLLVVVDVVIRQAKGNLKEQARKPEIFTLP